MAKSISFIIPTYRTDDNLLRRCIGSVTGLPTEWEIEIIVVDDGTPDSHTSDIISEFADRRISYYYQENAGPGQARNTGIEKATKEYVQFLDADDYLLSNIYAKCLSIIDKYSPDLLTFSFKNVTEIETETDTAPSDDMITYISSGIDFMLNNNFVGAACNIIAKRSLLQGLSFTPGILHEDEEFRPLLYLRSEKTVVTKLKPYAYYHHKQSTMGNIKPKKLERRFSDMLYVVDSLRNHAAKSTGKERDALENRIAQLCEAMLLTMIRLSPDKAFFSQWLSKLKENRMYPLPAYNSDLKHTLFRLIANSEHTILLIYPFLNQR